MFTQQGKLVGSIPTSEPEKTMRAILEIDKTRNPMFMRWFIHHAPHRRMHRAMLKKYREALWDAWVAAGQTKELIEDKVDVSITFIDPCGPDFDNLMVAFHQALDGKTGDGPMILKDDMQIVGYERIGIIWTGGNPFEKRRARP